MIPKDVWIENIVALLKQLASEEFQQKGWVKNEIHDYCTFVETSCGFFLDNDIDEFLKHALEFGISETQIAKIEAIRKAFYDYTNKHGDYEDPLLIVKDPEWHNVRELAKDALKSLGIEHYLDPSKEIFKSCLLDTIKDIAGPEFQESACLQEQSPIENTIKGTIQKFFKNYKSKEIIDHYKDYEVTENQVAKLSKLYDALKPYQNRSGDIQEFRQLIESPEWHHVQTLAAETVKAFNFKS